MGVVFSDGQFWWRNSGGERIVMAVRQYHGYPVVYSHGYYWGSENGRDYFVVGYYYGHYDRIQHMHLSMRLHLAHRKVYPVVFANDNYYGTNNGNAYRKVVFSDGQFWWRNNDGEFVVLPVVQFHGFPVVYSNGYHWVVRMAVITLWCTILTAVTIVSHICTLLCVCLFPMALCILITMGQSVTMLIPLCEVCRSTLGPFPLSSFAVPSN